MEQSDIKVQFTRTITYDETVETEIEGNDPLRAILAKDFKTFLITDRSVVDNKLGDIKVV